MKPELLSVFEVKMRDSSETNSSSSDVNPGADFLVVVRTLQQAIDFAMVSHPTMEITHIRKTNDQVYVSGAIWTDLVK